MNKEVTNGSLNKGITTSSVERRVKRQGPIGMHCDAPKWVPDPFPSVMAIVTRPVITARKRSLGKVMFSQACVKNSVHNYWQPPKHVRLASGRHTSYWNASLFIMYNVTLPLQLDARCGYSLRILVIEFRRHWIFFNFRTFGLLFLDSDYFRSEANCWSM